MFFISFIIFSISNCLIKSREIISKISLLLNLIFNILNKLKVSSFNSLFNLFRFFVYLSSTPPLIKYNNLIFLIFSFSSSP